jgi:uncharacterized protein (DUF2147 family)
MRLPILAVASVMLCSASAVAAAATDPRGVWLVEDQTGQIEIENCAGALWGILVWERMPGHDTENPDPSLRGRPTLGIPILLGMRPAPEPGLWRGQIYNSRNGKTYEASIKPVGPDVLHLEGCVLGGLFCGGQNWSRVKTPARPVAPDFCSRIPDLARGTH